MITVDTNLLVRGHRAESEWHGPAASRIRQLAEGRARWAIPWACVHASLPIATHPRIWDPPTPLPAAVEQLEAWMEFPTLVLLSEGGGHWPEVRSLLTAGRIQGSRIHDARVAALCLGHGVRELWTADRDFSPFPALPTKDPLSA